MYCSLGHGLGPRHTRIALARPSPYHGSPYSVDNARPTSVRLAYFTVMAYSGAFAIIRPRALATTALCVLPCLTRVAYHVSASPSAQDVTCECDVCCVAMCITHVTVLPCALSVVHRHHEGHSRVAASRKYEWDDGVTVLVAYRECTICANVGRAGGTECKQRRGACLDTLG